MSHIWSCKKCNYTLILINPTYTKISKKKNPIVRKVTWSEKIITYVKNFEVYTFLFDLRKNFNSKTIQTLVYVCFYGIPTNLLIYLIKILSRNIRNFTMWLSSVITKIGTSRSKLLQTLQACSPKRPIHISWVNSW